MPFPRIYRQGDTVRFYSALEDGRRSPNTWRVWTPAHSTDLYVTARSMAGMLKTSLHQSGEWKTSFVAKTPELIEADEIPPTRHIDTWQQPPEFSPGITHAITIVLPWTEFVTWPEDVPEETLRLMSEEGAALYVDVLMMRPTEVPETIHIPTSVVFAQIELDDDRQVVLVSRRVDWTDEDRENFDANKKAALTSRRSFIDRRPRPMIPEPAEHLTRLTMFATAANGHRLIYDGLHRAPLPEA